MSNMKPRDQALFNLEAKISRFGWTAYYISGGPGPDWHYTIGLVDRFDHPELITLGLDHRSAHAAAHEVVHHLEAGESLTPGRHTKHSLLEIPMALVPVDDAYWMKPYDYFLGWFDYYRATDRQLQRQALQIVWSDDEQRLPWEKDFDSQYEAIQPLLDQPPV